MSGASSRFFQIRFERKDYLLKLYRQDDDTFEDIEKSLFGNEKKGYKICKKKSLPGFPVCYDFGVFKGHYYFLLELINGKNVRILIKDNFDRDELKSSLPQLADNFGGLHGAGYVHCDIKPHNLVKTDEGEIKIVDLGHLQRMGRSPIKIGDCYGTPAYISPEQYQRFSLVAATDVYSLGMSIYQMFAEHPFSDAENLEQILMWQLYRKPLPLIYANPRVSKEFSDVVDRCLLKSPEARYRNGHELADALAGCC